MYHDSKIGFHSGLKGGSPKSELNISAGKQLIKVTERTKAWVSAEISRFKSALAQAQNPDKPRRALLQQLYDTIVVDNHLTSAIEKRMMRVTGQAFRIVDKDGIENKELMELFEQTWFLEFMETVLECVTHGPTVLIIQPPKANYFGLKSKPAPDFVEIPRAHYVPEKQAVILDLSDDEKLVYLNEPQHYPWCIHVGKANKLGLLYKAIPTVTYKNAASSAWAEYCDIFGQPIRMAKVPPNLDTKWLNYLDQQLDEMGRASYIRLPMGVDLELVSPSGRSGIEVYEKRLEYCNNENSKLVEGQTMTSDQGSSRAQGQVHENTADLYTYRDRVWLNGVINEELMPRLHIHGYKTDGMRFVWADEQEIDFDKQLEADKWLNDNFEIDHAYFAEKYGVPIIGTKGNGIKPIPKTSSVASNLEKVYSHSCSVCKGNTAPMASDPDLTKLRSILERIAKQIHGGDLPENHVPPELLLNTGDLYQTALSEGINPDVRWDAPDQAAFEFLRTNNWQFADARSQTELNMMRELLVGPDGKRSWSEFRQEVLKMNGDYFEPWLRTEFAHAQVSSVAASQWLQITEDIEAWPNLTYETVGDERVREKHQQLDGITRPVNDQFWNTAFPPNGWRCRCDVIQEDDSADLTPSTDANNASSIAVNDPKFRTNVGKSLSTFPQQHPYFEASPAEGSFSRYGFPKSDKMKASNFEKVTQKALSKWFDALPKAGESDKQITIGGRAASLNSTLIEQLATNNWLDAAAPIMEGAAPSETWNIRLGDNLVMTSIWFMKDSVAKAVVSVSKTAMKVIHLSTASAEEADLYRRGILIK